MRAGAGEPAQGRAEGIHVSRAGAVVDDAGHAGRPAPSSGPGGASIRDTATLGQAVGAARLPRAGVAEANVAAHATRHTPQGTTALSASAFSSQKRISIRRYISAAVVSCSWAFTLLPVRPYSLPRPKRQWAMRGRMSRSEASAMAAPKC